MILVLSSHKVAPTSTLPHTISIWYGMMRIDTEYFLVPLSIYSGWRESERLLCLCPERPKRPQVWPLRSSPWRGHRQGFSLQLSQHHPAQRLPYSRSSSAAVSRSPTDLRRMPRSHQRACRWLPDSSGLRCADYAGPHHLLHCQET